jgi:dsDNA-binding SOS-regulon protein
VGSPIFKLLHKSAPFIWTDETEEVFQELKQYLTSPPVMVAPEPGEPLLLYIATTTKAVSMVLVAERPEPPQAQETKEALANGSGSLGPEPVENPKVGVVAGSQLSKASLASERHAGPDNTSRSQLPEASSGLDDLEATAPQPPKTFLGPGSHGPSGPEPMEVDEPDPPWRVRTVQHPVYYISEVLHAAMTRYLEVHKLLYAVLIASRKLRHYFQAHKISVVTSYPRRAMLHNPNATGNIVKWTVELAEFELDFVVRHVIKSQVIANFVVD